MKMAKRYYKINELVWIKTMNKKGKVKALDKTTLTATVSYFEGKDNLVEATFQFQDIDKLRVKDDGTNNSSIEVKRDVILFAKVRPNAIVPSKRAEDAGYDFYANFEQLEMKLPKGKATLVPTGIASSLLPKYYLNLKHERGSTGRVAMSVLSGVVDSGYRGEIFVNIVPLDKDVIISKSLVDTFENETTIFYPYTKAIAQATLDLVPDVGVKEISYEQLLRIPSERGVAKLGASNK